MVNTYGKIVTSFLTNQLLAHIVLFFASHLFSPKLFMLVLEYKQDSQSQNSYQFKMSLTML